jgi:hypothetical protein
MVGKPKPGLAGTSASSSNSFGLTPVIPQITAFLILTCY